MARPDDELEYRNPKWHFQRRQNKQNAKKNQMNKSGRSVSRTYEDGVNKKRQDKDTERKMLLGKINKMILKQNALERASGMSLTSTTPQQAQNMGKAPPTDGAPKNTSQMNFDASGGMSMTPEVQKRVTQFTSLDDTTQIKNINSMNPHDPDNYQIIKYSATRGNPEVQGAAAWKLNLDDLESLIMPTTDNAKAVSALALKTTRPENWEALSKHSDALVRRTLVRNRNLPDDFLKNMTEDTDLNVIINLIDRTTDQGVLHELIYARKGPSNKYVKNRLIPKLDMDGLKILRRDSDPEISRKAGMRADGLFREKLKRGPNKGDSIQNSDDELVTAGDKNVPLPDSSWGSAVGSMNTTSDNQPSMVRNSLVIEINQFLTKAELLQKEGDGANVLTAEDTSTPTHGYSNSLKKKIKDNLHFKSEDGVAGILNIVKSVGEEFFGEE